MIIEQGRIPEKTKTHQSGVLLRSGTGTYCHQQGKQRRPPGGTEQKALPDFIRQRVVSYRHVVKEDPETASTSHKIYKAFRAGPGDYLGVQSFFSGWFRSSSDLIAETDLELAYIDTATPAVDVERYGTLLEQFVPAIVHELAARNTRVFDRTAEKEEALRMLHRSEMAATLGRLSAGMAP